MSLTRSTTSAEKSLGSETSLMRSPASEPRDTETREEASSYSSSLLSLQQAERNGSLFF